MRAKVQSKLPSTTAVFNLTIFKSLLISPAGLYALVVPWSLRQTDELPVGAADIERPVFANQLECCLELDYFEGT
jgi:hypothetical protein